MLKKVFAVLVTVLMAASLFVVHAFAGALNPDNGCKVEVQIKKAAPGAVVHDGVISPGEYNEVEINRNSDTTDMLLTWNGSGSLLEDACAFLQNVHFYVSWDENGLNFAAQGTLLEDPRCEGTYPSELHEENGKQFVGDEFFMFQFGGLFKIDNPDDWDNEYLYRSFGINTETGEILVGSYWADGHTGSLNLTEGTDYYVRVDGRTVTYEVTYPLASVLKGDQISGSLPVDGSDFYFTISLTGGSKGHNFEESATYAVSLGDGGYMTTRRIISDYSGAHGVISMEPVVEQATEPGTDPGTTPDPDPDPNPGTDPVPGTDPTTGTVAPDPENPVENPTENPGTPGNQQPGQRTVAPTTGDPMALIAAVSALTAGAALVIKKRKF